MSSKRFPFFLRISPQNTHNKTKSHHYLPHTIYSLLFYPEETDYRVISSIYPSDTIILSPSKAIKGIAMNKKMISKDDLYQYHLDHQANTQSIQFSLVFNELVSNAFVYQKLKEQNQSSSQSNLFIYGKQRMKFASSLLTVIFKINNELKLTLHSFNYISQEKKLVKNTMKNISIKSINDIPPIVKNMKNEYNLSIINRENEEDNKMNSNRGNSNHSRDSLIISATYGKTTMNLIAMNIDYNNRLNDAQTLLQCGFNHSSSFILNITEQSFKSTERILKFHYLFLNQDSFIKLPLVKLLVGNTTNSSITNSLPNLQSSRNPRRVPSSRTQTIAIDHQNDNLNNSLFSEHRPVTSNLCKSPQYTLINLNKNSIDSSDREDEQRSHSKIDFENPTNLAELLEAEKREKLSLMIEAKCLNSKIESHQSTIMKKNEKIKQLDKDKSLLEREHKELKEKYNQLYDAYNRSQNRYNKINTKQEINFTDIEEKISLFESELIAFQKANEKLTHINTTQAIQIKLLKNEKEQLYSKYKSSKVQIDQLGDKLNQLEAEFIKLSANNLYTNYPISLSSNEEDNINITSNHNNNDYDNSDSYRMKNKDQRGYLIK